MGLPVGTQVTVDNALKMMMVKSANDMAVVLAEGVGGSVDDFAQQMTDTAHSSACRNRISSIRTGCRRTARSPRHAISPFSPAR